MGSLRLLRCMVSLQMAACLERHCLMWQDSAGLSIDRKGSAELSHFNPSCQGIYTTVDLLYAWPTVDLLYAWPTVDLLYAWPVYTCSGTGDFSPGTSRELSASK